MHTTLTFVPAPVAFGIWTGVSLAAAVHLLCRANQILPDAGRLRLAVIFFTALPVVQAFVLGQPVLLLASALAESYLALRRGAEVRGGVWLGLLVLKPQYGLLLGLFAFASFFLVLALALDRLGIGLSFALATLLALSVQGATLVTVRALER